MPEATAVANQPWSYFEERVELEEHSSGLKAHLHIGHKDYVPEEEREYAHPDERSGRDKLRFDTPERWRYFMVEKSYSEVVAARKEMMDYLMVRMSKAVLEDMWKENKNRTWLNRVKLTRDQYFSALTKAWKACERSAIQHTLEHYVSSPRIHATALPNSLLPCLSVCLAHRLASTQMIR
jgi:hypothetical protein